MKNLDTSSQTFNEQNKDSLNELRHMLGETNLELREGIAILGENSPIHSAILEFCEKTKNMGPEGNLFEGIVKPIELLCGQIDSFKNVLKNNRGNGNGEINEALLKRVAAMNQHMNKLSSGMDDDVMPQIKTMNETMRRISASFDTMKTANVSSESKPGFFSRMRKK